MSLRRHAGLLLLAACSTPAEHSTAAPVGADASAACVSGTKRCGGDCVPVSLPEFGCGAPECTPCSRPHAQSACSADGRCVSVVCENGFADCNGDPDDGCEADLNASDTHCGACGLACPPSTTCKRGVCVDRDSTVATEWLATKTNAWCFETRNQMLNLCGDVDFCFDARFMRAYPNGIAVDVGFAWEASSAGGNVVSLGGDCNGPVTIFISDNALLGAGGLSAGLLQVKLDPGKHLVSYQLNDKGTALFLDGLLAARGGAPQSPIRLLNSCGPGLVLGQRISYWWEASSAKGWGHVAPFFVHLREGISDVGAYSVQRAISAGPGTAFLFDETGANGATWTASVGGLVAVAKNALSQTPELDAAASGPLPAWKPLSACALK